MGLSGISKTVFLQIMILEIMIFETMLGYALAGYITNVYSLINSRQTPVG